MIITSFFPWKIDYPEPDKEICKERRKINVETIPLESTVIPITIRSSSLSCLRRLKNKENSRKNPIHAKRPVFAPLPSLSIHEGSGNNDGREKMPDQRQEARLYRQYLKCISKAWAYSCPLQYRSPQNTFQRRAVERGRERWPKYQERRYGN